MHFHRSFFSLLLAFSVTSLSYSQAPKPLAGDKFQNVTVLHEMPAEQMGKVMNIMSAALGVGCAHCHKGYDFASEDAVKKETARKMIAMTLALNKDQFGGRVVVTCVTCHQGQIKPRDAAHSATELANSTTAKLPRILPVAHSEQNRTPSEPQGASPRLDPQTPSTMILAGHQRAIRVDGSAETVGDQTWSAERIEPNGKKENMDITLMANKRWEQVTHYERITIKESYQDGGIEKIAGDKKLELKPDEAALIKIEGHLALGLPLSSLFANWTLASEVSIDGQPMHVLQTIEGEMTHSFMFDKQTSLLRRRTTSQPTVLGAHITDVAYDDYQVLGKRRAPMKTTFSMPSIDWQVQIIAPR